MPDLLPRVSIITVVYNGEATLERTILSVKSLNYSNLEYIIIDGASKDGTLDIVERHEEVVSRLISEPDKGLYDAMNKGLDLASGDYVWFINSGDEVADPELLNRIFGINSSADIYYGDTLIVDNNGEEIGHRRLSPPENLTWLDFRKGMLVSHQSIIVARRIAEHYDLQYRFSADFDWVLKALRKAERIVNGKAVFSRFLDGGLTKSNILPGLKERFSIMVRNYGFITTLLSHIPIGLKFLYFLIRYKRF